MEHSLNQSANSKDLKYKNQKTGYLLMLVFLLPVIIAYGLLKTGIYQNFGTFNKGVLLDPPVSLFIFLKKNLNDDQLNQLQNRLAKNWWIAFEMPEQCLEACQQRLLQIRQSLLTLGSDQNRVQPLILTHAKSDPQYLKLLQQQPQAQHLAFQIIENKNAATEFDAFAGQNSGGLYIIDPLGNAMLYYAAVIAPSKAISQAKSVIKDLKYLLKVSRIG